MKRKPRKPRKTREQKTINALDECMTKMFAMVGEKYPNKELTDKVNWYRLRKWSEIEEKIFIDWMVKYLMKEARYLKERAVMEASFFVLNYGWTTYKKEIDRENSYMMKVIKQ